MKTVRKIGIFACVVLFAGTLLVGCDKSNDQKHEGGGKSVTINFWEQDDPKAQKVLDELIENFQKKNPDILVNRTHVETEDIKKNYTTASLGKKGPDIVLGPKDNLELFLSRNLIVPISNIVGEDFLKKLDSKALNAAKYNEKQYIIPDRWGNELLLIYNKKLVSQMPETFEELAAVCKKLQEDKKVQYGLVFDETDPLFTIPFLGAFGGKVFEGEQTDKAKVSLDTPVVKEWMQFIKELQKDEVIPKSADYDLANNLFKEGKAAFIINGPWSFNEYKEANLDFGITALPPIKGKFPMPYSTVMGYTVSASVAEDNDKKEAVEKFLAYALNKDSQLKMVDVHNQLPTNLEAVDDANIQRNPLLAGRKDALDKSIPMPITAQMKPVWEAIRSIQQEVLKGGTKPEQAPGKMQKKAEDGIKALKP